MSTIEERLSRDIEAVTGGIVVTESDLREASNEVQQRIKESQQRGRRLGLVAAAAAAVVVVGIATWQGLQSDDAAPSPARPGPTQAPTELSDSDAQFLAGDAATPQLLEGVWRLDNPTVSRMLFMFTADGEVRWDDTGQLSEDPLVVGSYEVAGDQITVDISGGLAGCAGEALALGAAVTAERVVHLVPLDLGSPDGCGGPARHQWALEPVLPIESSPELKAPPGLSWDRPAGYQAVQATWFDPQGGYVVELRDDGTFAVLTGMGEQADRGTWNLDSSTTRITLVSSADSPTCRDGDVFVLSNLRARDMGTLMLQGDLERNDCDLNWKGTGWFKLAP